MVVVSDRLSNKNIRVRNTILMNKRVDISGQRFGSLVAIKPLKKEPNSPILWKCVCDCGNITAISVGKLRSGNKTSCGCGKTRIASRKKTINTPEHFVSTLKHINSNTTSVVRGVSFNKQFQKWDASITFRGKRKHLGRFTEFDDAVAARKKAEEDILLQQIDPSE